MSQEQQIETPAFMPGIFSGISNANYHADRDSYSSSLIKKLDIPALAKYAMDNPSEYKDCFRIGGAVHKYILERSDFESEFLIGIDCARRSNDDKHEWAQWFFEHGADGEHIISHPAAMWNGLFEAATGKHMVTPEEKNELILMAESVSANKNALRLLEEGEPEQSVYWVDDETGLQLRCRPDYLSKFCSDLKSCRSAKPGAASRDMVNLGYHISQAMYTDGLLQVTGEYHPFLFIFVEKTPPYLCAVYGLDEEAKELGWSEYRRFVGKLADCLEKNSWPGLEDNLQLSLPGWAFS